MNTWFKKNQPNKNPNKPRKPQTAIIFVSSQNLAWQIRQSLELATCQLGQQELDTLNLRKNVIWNKKY